jgi:hypothetical protein
MVPQVLRFRLQALSVAEEEGMTGAEWLSCTDWERMWKLLHGKASVRKARLFACACCRRVWHLLGEGPSRDAVLTAERFADGQATRDELSDSAAAASDAAYELLPECENGGREALHGGSSGPARAAEAAGLAARDRSREPFPTSPFGWQDTTFDRTTVHCDTAAEAAYHCALAAGWAAAVADQQAGQEAVRQGQRQAGWEAVARAAEKRGAGRDAEQRAQVALLHDLFDDLHRQNDPAAWRSPNALVLQLARAAYEERILPGGSLDPARLVVLADALEETGCTDHRLLDHLRGPGPHVRGCWAVDLVLAKE